MADEEGTEVEETTRTRRLRKDPRRGLSVSIPKPIAERLPNEADVEFALREDDGVIAVDRARTRRPGATRDVGSAIRIEGEPMTDWIPIREVSLGDRVKLSSGSSWGYFSDRASAEASSEPFGRVVRLHENNFNPGLYEVSLEHGYYSWLASDTCVLRAD